MYSAWLAPKNMHSFRYTIPRKCSCILCVGILNLLFLLYVFPRILLIPVIKQPCREISIFYHYLPHVLQSPDQISNGLLNISSQILLSYFEDNIYAFELIPIVSSKYLFVFHVLIHNVSKCSIAQFRILMSSSLLSLILYTG